MARRLFVERTVIGGKQVLGGYIEQTAPAPKPNAIGSVPTSADMVVIIMGRKRTRAASTIASAGAVPCMRWVSSAKSIIMMAFFLTMPISMMIPTNE